MAIKYYEIYLNNILININDFDQKFSKYLKWITNPDE